MPFFHFVSTDKKSSEEIVITLENTILIEEELEGYIRHALNNGTFERTTFIVPSVIGIDGKSNKYISDERLSSIIESIVKRIKGK